MLLEHSNENWFTDLFKKKKKEEPKEKVNIIDNSGYLDKDKQLDRVAVAWTKPDDLLIIWKEYLDDEGDFSNLGKYPKLDDVIKDTESFLEASKDFSQHPDADDFDSSEEYKAALKDFRDKINESLFSRVNEEREEVFASDGGWDSMTKVEKLCRLIKDQYRVKNAYDAWVKRQSPAKRMDCDKTFKHLSSDKAPEGLVVFRKMLIEMIEDAIKTRKFLFGQAVKSGVSHFSKGNESMENLNTSMDEFFQQTQELQDFIEDGQKIDSSLEIYSMICDTIESCGGVTSALEHMFGENFTSVASMEAEAAAEKDAWYKRLWQWIKDFFTKLWAWFKSWFQTRKGMINKLQELKGKADRIKYPFKIPVPYKWLVEKVESLKVLLKIMDDGASMQDIKDAAYERAKAKFAAFWKDIFAEFDPDDDKRLTIKDSRELRDFIDAIIDVLRLSEEVSESYKLIETKFETMAKVAKASDFSTWVAKKSMVIASWNCNSKMFRAALRISNVILARAKEA